MVINKVFKKKVTMRTVMLKGIGKMVFLNNPDLVKK